MNKHFLTCTTFFCLFFIIASAQPGTKCWPGSHAVWNERTQTTDCHCDPGLVWNMTKTACVDPAELARSTDCAVYPGSYSAWNDRTQRVECYCPEGKVWNEARTTCIDKQPEVNCYPGSYASVNARTGQTECFCREGLVWNSTKTACVSPEELLQTADCSGYPGSYAAYNKERGRVECFCPEGKVWNSDNTACVDKVSCYPGSHAAYNPQTKQTECFCDEGLTWNSSHTACVDPKELVTGTDCSVFPGSYAAWNEQTARVECFCPEGKVWNATQTACVDAVANNSSSTAATKDSGWKLVAAYSEPAQPAQGWQFTNGHAAMNVYTGDKAEFSWTAPPAQFGDEGFTITITVKSMPQPGNVLAAAIGLAFSGLETDAPLASRSAAVTPPDGPASLSRTLSFRPSSAEAELRIDLMKGAVRYYYRYKRQ